MHICGVWAGSDVAYATGCVRASHIRLTHGLSTRGIGSLDVGAEFARSGLGDNLLLTVTGQAA